MRSLHDARKSAIGEKASRFILAGLCKHDGADIIVLQWWPPPSMIASYEPFPNDLPGLETRLPAALHVFCTLRCRATCTLPLGAKGLEA